MALKLAYKAMHFLEAGMIASLLESYNIKVFVLDQHMNITAEGGSIYAPIRIMVDEKYLEKSLKIIEDHNAATNHGME